MTLGSVFRLGLTCLVFAGLSACATKVERLDAREVKDLSGAWNDTDSRQVSEEMIRDSLARNWLFEWTLTHGSKRPTVIVGEVRNLSHEHINVNTFTSDVERALINSGKVDFVASRSERGDIRAERRDQDIHAREDTRKAMGQEIGADFMLQGTINTIIDPSGDTQVRYYQVNLTLVSLADNRKVWVGQKEIKKLISRSKLRF
jgi:uncharacterized protein (TIGR02722 family)